MILKKQPTNFTPEDELNIGIKLLHIGKHYLQYLHPGMIKLDIDNKELICDFGIYKTKPLYIPELNIEASFIKQHGFDSLILKNFETKKGIKLISDIDNSNIETSESERPLSIAVDGIKIGNNVVLDGMVFNFDIISSTEPNIENVNKIILKICKPNPSIFITGGFAVPFKFEDTMIDQFMDNTSYHFPQDNISFIKSPDWSYSRIKKHTQWYKPYGKDIYMAQFGQN